MKKTSLLLVLLVAGAQAQSLIIPTASETPAEQKIGWATAEVKAHPEEPQPYNDLAVALVGRARETGDPDYYEKADAALEGSLGKDQHNFEGLKAKVMILLGRHEFDKAIELAQKLNTDVPDDVLAYGLLADGLIETGNYKQAVGRVQWMLNLRSGNVPGLLRAARLRWIYGDREGALDLYSRAYQEMSPTQTEDQAWTLTQMADIQIATGHLDIAEQFLHSALQLFPGYYLSLESSAGLETAGKHYAQAVSLLRERNESFPSLESRYELAKALERAGETAEAKTAYAEFEDLARRLSDAPNNADRELIFYYLSSGNKPAEALRIAVKEARKRQDIATLDAYAWALYVNGQYSEAEKQMKTALTTGIHDTAILYHAGMIAEKRRDNSSATAYLKSSLELNPSSEVASEAQRALDECTKAMATPRTAVAAN
jgi:tetratricopeptide (TPR) repeat protein